MGYVYLAFAIVAEVIATSALKASHQFRRPLPSAVVVIGYVAAFYCLSLVLQSMSVGIAYAIWSGLGIVLLATIGAIVYGELPDLPALVGMALIIAGVVLMNVFSQTTSH